MTIETERQIDKGICACCGIKQKEHLWCEKCMNEMKDKRYEEGYALAQKEKAYEGKPDVWEERDALRQESIKSERERILKEVKEWVSEIGDEVNIDYASMNLLIAKIDEELKQQISDNHSQQTKPNTAPRLSSNTDGENKDSANLDKTADTHTDKSRECKSHSEQFAVSDTSVVRGLSTGSAGSTPVKKRGTTPLNNQKGKSEGTK